MTTIKLRRDTAVRWSLGDPVLFDGEVGVELDSGRFKLGDGERRWSDLTYFIPEDQFPSFVGPMGPQGPPGTPGQDFTQFHPNDWHLIGFPGQPDFASGVTNFGGTYGPVRFTRDSAGIVRLAGLAAHAFSIGYPGQRIFTLPDGYRPSYELFLRVPSNGINPMSQLAINVDGKGEVALADGANYASLDGCSFPAEIYATIIAFGDSLTNGFSATVPWATVLNAMLGLRSHVVKKGVNGENSIQVASRLNPDVYAYTPTYCIVECGVNDLMLDETTVAIQNNLQTIFNGLLGNNVIPIVLTLSPWKNYADYTDAREVVRKEVNNWIRSLPYVTVDLETSLGDGAVNPALSSGYDSGDGLHPNNNGHAVIAAEIFAQAFDSIQI
jgi:lysophospholipase L1-like esterase